jgi:hypothetical protein
MACSVQGRPKKEIQVKSKVKSMLSILFDVKGIVCKELSWQAKHLISNTAVMFYCVCIEMCKDFTLNFGNKRTGCCITTMHHFTLPFSPGNFLPKTT